LKPALASGTLRCIGSTTFSDVKQSFDKDRALSRRFQKMGVREPSEAETIEILKGLKKSYESHHGVTYPDETLEAAVTLSTRHLKDLHQPDKEIDVIYEAGAGQRTQPAAAAGAAKKLQTEPAGNREPGTGNRDVTVSDIEKIVAKIARVPVQAVSSDDKVALKNLDVELKSVIFGQDAAIEEVASAI